MAMKTNADLERQPGVSLLEERLKADGLLRQFEDERIPIVEVDSFPDLGRMVALRFIEWVQQNSEGVVSLPTGKTPEYFIRWTNHILENWAEPDIMNLRDTYALAPVRPEFSRLHFVQIDAFFPLPSDHPNSFVASIKRHYL